MDLDRMELLQRANDELEKKLIEAETTLKEKLGGHETELEEMTIKIEELTSELHASKREEKELRSKERMNSNQISTLESEIAKLTRQIESARASYLNLQRQYQNQCAESEKYRDSLRDRDETIRTLTQGIPKDALEQVKWKMERGHYEERIARLEEELMTAETAHASLDQQKEENLLLKETIDRLRFDMDELRNSVGGGPGGHADLRSSTIGDSLVWHVEDRDRIEDAYDESSSDDEDIIETIVSRKKKVSSKANRGFNSQMFEETKEYSDNSTQCDPGSSTQTDDHTGAAYQTLQRQYQEQCAELEKYRNAIQGRDETIHTLTKAASMHESEQIKWNRERSSYEDRIQCLEELSTAQTAHALLGGDHENSDLKETMLAGLHPETIATILFAVESSKIPLVLDLLLDEAKRSNLDYIYRQKCTKWLRLLVNKHNVLPPSLFVNNIIMESLRVLAVGGYSDIYRGLYQTKTVCLKVLKMYVEEEKEARNGDLHEFYKETLLWTQLNHPNLLPFLGVNTTLFPGKLALVSPWMINGQITKFLELNPKHDRLTVISEIAAGILYLHSRNIVHGDIKGANVLVDEQGHCYLADFGLATAAMTCTLLSTVSTSSGGKGTMRWMAPELFTSHFEESESDNNHTGSLGQQSHKDSKHNKVKLARDIYAYACTVYEIVAGTVPFAHLKHDVQVMFQMLNGERPQRPTVTAWCPDNIWALVQQCWAQETYLRPTAAIVYAYLNHLKELCKKGLPWENEFLESVSRKTECIHLD